MRERKGGYRLGWEKMNRDRVEQGDVNPYSLVHMIRRGIPMTFSMAWSYGTGLGGSYVDIVVAGSSSCGLITSLNRGLIYPFVRQKSLFVLGAFGAFTRVRGSRELEICEPRAIPPFDIIGIFKLFI